MDSDGEDDTLPLLEAAYAGDVHALRRAIADGADLHVEDEENYTALHWLVNNTPQSDDDLRIACISALLDAGADVNRLGGLHDFDRDQIPGTPLMDAVFLCESNPGSCAAERTIIDMLIRAGADPKIASADSFTPLHMAAVWGYWHIVPVLLAAGAEVNAIWPSRDTDERGDPLD
jgi:ankyrin repeat protein